MHNRPLVTVLNKCLYWRREGEELKSTGTWEDEYDSTICNEPLRNLLVLKLFV